MSSVEILQAATAVFDIHLTPHQVQQFARYLALLQTWNRRLNLSAIRDPHGIQIRHFLDALTCATVMGDLNGRSLIDVGTGAGFPGLPLKILFPDLQLTLVESTTKKTKFLHTVIAELGLDGTHVLDERAETVGQMPQHRSRYDWAAARAVAELRVLLEYLLPLCRVGGQVVAQKGPDAAAEVASAETALEMLGGGEPVLTPVQLPEREIVHYLVVIAKERETPVRYPRRPGIPAKRPL